MSKIALYTFGIAKHRIGSHEMDGFAAAVRDVYGSAHDAPGFVAHAMDARPDLASTRKIGEDFGPWGVYAVPRLAADRGIVDELRIITTLSLWSDLAQARRFVYGGAHWRALQRRREWFEVGDWPSHVVWQVAGEDHPRWADAAGKLDGLASGGSTAAHFTFADSSDGGLKENSLCSRSS